MSGALPLHTLYVFVVWAGRNLTLLEFFCVQSSVNCSACCCHHGTVYYVGQETKFSIIFEVFKTVVIIAVLYVMIACSLVRGYRPFGGTCCLHLQQSVFTLWLHAFYFTSPPPPKYAYFTHVSPRLDISRSVISVHSSVFSFIRPAVPPFSCI